MKLSKRILALCVAVVLLLSVSGLQYVSAEDGDAVVVYTLEALQSAITNNQDVTLGCDIEVTAWTYLNGEYSATLNGNGYTMDCTNLAQKTTGLIKTLSGTVKNLTIKGMRVSAAANVRGALCHENYGTITNVNMVDATVTNTGNYTSCIAGKNSGTISYVNVVNADLSKTSGEDVGGITGQNLNGAKVEYCTVSGLVGGKNHVGGIVGFVSEGSSVKGCVNYANVTITSSRVGGIVGTLNEGASLSYCVNYGKISSSAKTATRLVGGIATVKAAWTSNPMISYCLNAGQVVVYEANEAYAGAILGGNNNMTGQYVSNCYALSSSVGIISVDADTGASSTAVKPITSDNTTDTVMVFHGAVVDALSAALVDADHLTDAFTYTEGAAYPIVVKVAHTHDTDAVTEKAASCTEDGNIAYWRCTVCGKYYSDAACTKEITLADTVVPASHSWNDATCTAPKTCAICRTTEGEALGHTMTHQVAAGATCVKDGNLEYWYCSRCEIYFKNEAGTEAYSENGWIVVSEGHQWNNETPKTCTVCYTTSCEESGHSLTHQEAAGASCAKNGNLEYWYCSSCGKYFKDEACENVYADGEWVTSVPHSATKTDAQEATCSSDGNLEYWYCTGCEKHYKNEACTEAYAENGWVIPGGHTVSKTNAKAASCAEAGNLDYWYCSVCNKYFKDEACTEEYAEGEWIVTAEHTLTGTEAKEPTETADGYIAYWTCSACGKYFADEAAAKELAEGEWILHAAPTTGSGNTANGGSEPASGAGAINSEEDLLNMIKAVSADDNGVGLTAGYWYLTTDITVSSWTQIPYFNGTLDGNGYSISFADDLKVETALIKKLGGNAVIKNLTISGLTMTASGEKMAAVVNENNGILYRVSVEDLTVTTSHNNVGGIVYTNKGILADIKVNGITVKGTKDVGGVCYENKGVISDVTAVDASVTGNNDRAAIITCVNNKGTVEYCVTYGQVTSKYHVAGIVARGNGTVRSCINYADVTATNSRAAGIVASAMVDCTITNCGNYGTITSQTNGGKTAGVANLLSADATDVTVTNCFNAGKIMVNSTAAVGVGAVLGNIVTDATVTNCYAIENMIFCSEDNSQYADSAAKDANNGTLISAETFADVAMCGKLNANAFVYLSEAANSVVLAANPNPVTDPSPETGDSFVGLSLVLLLCSGAALVVCGKKRFSL